LIKDKVKRIEIETFKLKKTVWDSWLPTSEVIVRASQHLFNGCRIAKPLVEEM
jgi:hypothetical protein